MDRGKWTITIILSVALASGIFAWWYRYTLGSRVLQLWGSRTTVLVQNAPHVDLLRLSNQEVSATGAGEPMLQNAARRDISDARGLIHARHSLLDDASFVWNSSETNCSSPWDVALQFQQSADQATFLLDFDCRRIHLLERRQEAQLTEAASQALQEYLSPLLPDD